MSAIPLSMLGIYDWLVSILLAVVIAGIFELLIGRQAIAKTTRVIVDIATGLISLVGILMLFSWT